MSKEGQWSTAMLEDPAQERARQEVRDIWNDIPDASFHTEYDLLGPDNKIHRHLAFDGEALPMGAHNEKHILEGQVVRSEALGDYVHEHKRDEMDTEIFFVGPDPQTPTYANERGLPVRRVYRIY